MTGMEAAAVPGTLGEWADCGLVCKQLLLVTLQHPRRVWWLL